MLPANVDSGNVSAVPRHIPECVQAWEFAEFFVGVLVENRLCAAILTVLRLSDRVGFDWAHREIRRVSAAKHTAGRAKSKPLRPDS